VDIVLGVSLTPKTVRLVLVEGVAGDGKIVDHDTFDVTPSDEAATSSASSQVVAAVQGTLESAREGGHQLKAIGVTWSDHEEASKLRDALAAAGVDDAILVSELHAAGALAQTAGRAVGYESTALLFLDRDAATLSVVRTDDGSIVKVLSRSLHSTDAMAVLADMASAVAAQETPPEGMFVVGAGRRGLGQVPSAGPRVDTGQCPGGVGSRPGPRCGDRGGQRADLRRIDRRSCLLTGS
jgi:hypothetical protein